MAAWIKSVFYRNVTGAVSTGRSLRDHVLFWSILAALRQIGSVDGDHARSR